MTDAERMRELLRYANYAKVAGALGVSRTSVAAWAKGRDVSPFRLRQVEGLLLPEREEAPTPEWAQGLREDVAAIRSGVESEAIGLAALRAVLESIGARLPPPADDPLDDPAPPLRAGRRGR